MVGALERRIPVVFAPTLAIEWLLTLPGVGTLAVVIALEGESPAGRAWAAGPRR